jgi:hypothetical protein
VVVAASCLLELGGADLCTCQHGAPCRLTVPLTCSGRIPASRSARTDLSRRQVQPAVRLQRGCTPPGTGGACAAAAASQVDLALDWQRIGPVGRW